MLAPARDVPLRAPRVGPFIPMSQRATALRIESKVAAVQAAG